MTEGRFKNTGGTKVEDKSKRHQYETAISSEQAKTVTERMREDMKDYEINKLKAENQALNDTLSSVLSRLDALEGAGA